MALEVSTGAGAGRKVGVMGAVDGEMGSQCGRAGEEEEESVGQVAE